MNEEFSQKDIETNRRAELDMVVEYSPDEIILDIEESLVYTDVIINGFHLSEQFGDAASIIFAGLCRLRTCLENTQAWMEENLIDDEDEEVEENVEDSTL